ncbi:MAG: sulfite exporter TauE/SafE family protein [Methanomicrobia archaeon]|nr:sulfite exporter TauE/SafE family protein [Methanomicrobia archaeon]
MFDALLNDVIANSDFVLLVAFLLGVMTSISPCPLATNIAAIAYISRDVKNPRHTPFTGLTYTLGRIVAYSVMGVGILVLGMNVIDVSLALQGIHGTILGMVMIVTGLVMIGLIRLNLTFGSGGLTERLGQKAARFGLVGAFLLGVLFALAFCPYSAVLFFGALIPLGLASDSGLILPAIYGLGTGIPVLIFSLFFFLGVQEMNKHVKNVYKLERLLREVIGLLFVALGLYLVFG